MPALLRSASLWFGGIALCKVLLSGGTAMAADCRITVLGDSLTAGYGVDVEQAFPALLERRLQNEGYDCTVTNAGVNGDTTAGGLARLDWALADEPSHVIVELGANDGLRGLPVAAMEDNLAAIIERLQDSGQRVLLTGMLAPPNLGRPYADDFAAVFPRLAERYDVPLYPFFLDGVAAERRLNQPDGIHPTAEGIAVIVERMLPQVRDWLDATLPRESG